MPSQISSRTVIAHDVDEHAHNLSNWEQSYDQLAAGRFDGVLEEWKTEGLQIFRERNSHAVRQSCCVWPDAYWFGIEQPVAGSIRMNGRQVRADMIMTRPGNREFELVTPDRHEILGIVIQRNILLEEADRHGCTIAWSALANAELLHVDSDGLQACRRHIAALLSPVGQCDDITPGSEQQRSYSQEQVVAALVALLDSSEVESHACNSLSRRHHIVTEARQYAKQNQAESLTVPMLCAHLHVSRRTLQYCFEDVLGMSPMHYLRSWRLNGVRRQLMQSDRGLQRIGDVAAAWGFTNFSQFSSDYKKLFGSSPSAAQRLSV